MLLFETTWHKQKYFFNKAAQSTSFYFTWYQILICWSKLMKKHLFETESSPKTWPNTWPKNYVFFCQVGLALVCTGKTYCITHSVIPLFRGAKPRPALATHGRFTVLAALRSWPLYGPGRITVLAALRSWPVYGPGRFTVLAALRSWPLYGPGRFTSEVRVFCDTSRIEKYSDELSAEPLVEPLVELFGKHRFLLF